MAIKIKWFANSQVHRIYPFVDPWRKSLSCGQALNITANVHWQVPLFPFSVLMLLLSLTFVLPLIVVWFFYSLFVFLAILFPLQIGIQYFKISKQDLISSFIISNSVLKLVNAPSVLSFGPRSYFLFIEGSNFLTALLFFFFFPLNYS